MIGNEVMHRLATIAELAVQAYKQRTQEMARQHNELMEHQPDIVYHGDVDIEVEDD